MKLKWYGTATIMLEHERARLLFDPFFPLNDEAFMPDATELSAACGILVTHGHLDHIAGIPRILDCGVDKPDVYCTAAPRSTLIAKGVDEKLIKEIKPGDALNIGPFEARALKGEHVFFDAGIIIKRLFSLRNLKYRRNLPYLLKENKICVEAGETLVYDIRAAQKRILLLGSLNLDDDTEYPQGCDLLILPFQGRSDICRYAMSFISRLQPKKVLLDHFDDTFPPISSAVNVERFESAMRDKHPDIPVICTHAGLQWLDV